VRKPLKGEWRLDVTDCQYIRVLKGNKGGSNNAIDDNGSRWSERGECSKPSDILDSIDLKRDNVSNSLQLVSNLNCRSGEGATILGENHVISGDFKWSRFLGVKLKVVGFDGLVTMTKTVDTFVLVLVGNEDLVAQPIGGYS
jgi:hypothetical protein